MLSSDSHWIYPMQVANTPYDYQAPDCSDNSVIFNVESDREEELINPEHCGPPSVLHYGLSTLKL